MLSQKKHRTGTSHWLSGLRVLALPRFCSLSIHFPYDVADSMLLERRVKTLWGKGSLPPAEASSLFLERETPALYPVFHNESRESNKWTRSCCWLQLTVSGFATWKQTAFCFLSCSFTMALEVGRHQNLGPISHAPLSTHRAGFCGGALDPKEGNTYLQETLSL